MLNVPPGERSVVVSGSILTVGVITSPTIALPSVTSTPVISAFVSSLSVTLLRSSLYVPFDAVLLTVNSTVMNVPADATGVFPDARVIP